MQIDPKDVIIPLLSAFAASGLTHVFTFRRTKSELLLRDRVQAFADLHKKLVQIGRYCHARASQEDGSDFSLTTESLSPEENRSVLEHLHELRGLQDRSFVYYPKSVKRKLAELDTRLLLICGHELRCAHDPYAPTGATADYYDSLAILIKKTTEYVHSRSPLRWYRRV